MTKNPFINALSATAYIAAVACFMFYGKFIFGNREDTILMPIMMLSLFVLSAASMACIFFFQPVQLYLDGEKKAAADLLLKTIVIFAGTTLVVILLAFLFG